MSESDTVFELSTKNTRIMDGHVVTSGGSGDVVHNGNIENSRNRESKIFTEQQGDYNEGSNATVTNVRVRAATGQNEMDISCSNQNWPDDEEQLKYGAKHAIKLFAPASLCMIVVVATISCVNFDSIKDVYLVYTPLNKKGSDVKNILIHIFITLVVTILLTVLYKFCCKKLIHGYLIVSSLMPLSYFSYCYLKELLQAYNLPVDNPTLLLLMWNFGVVGMVCIKWQGPLLLQQAYVIFVAALMTFGFIKYFPEWITWEFLAVISIWKTVQQMFPALGDSSTANGSKFGIQYSPPPQLETNTPAQDDNSIGEEQTEMQELNSSSVQRPQLEHTEEKREVKLSLCDSIFYSFLMGKFSFYGDWNTTLACFVAILVGLCFTLLFLAIFKKVLPALPISLTFGLIFYFATNEIVSPFANNLAIEQVFI